MRSRWTRNFISVAVLFYLSCAGTAEAGIYYDIAVKGVYEDNVIGLLSDKRGGYAGMTDATTGGGPMMTQAMGGPGMGPGPGYTGSSSASNSDTSIDFFADLGASRSIAQNTSVFVTGSAEHTSYSSFSQFDATIGGLSGGLSRRFGGILTARIAVNGLIKRFRDSQRDATAYGVSLVAKEKPTGSFWLKEGYVYERDDADSPFFSYDGNSLSVWAGYVILPKTTALLGYNYLVRDYDEPSGFQVTAHTVSVGLEYELLKKMFLDAQYDHQASDSNVPGTDTTDNIFSLGARYSY